MSARISQLALSFLEGVGPVYARRLVGALDSPDAIFEESESVLESLNIVPKSVLTDSNRQAALDGAQEEMVAMEKHKIENLFFTDPRYPQRLEYCSDAPINLYIKGNLDLNPRRCISIVGTRFATEYGIRMVESLLSKLDPAGNIIVSGLAYGIDIAAHRESNKNGIANVAVLAHGLDKVYPVQHRKEALLTLERGAWISEFPCGTNPDRENFPMRNRIVAGMSDLTIVVESASKGGSLITANLAHSYNREIAAFPGRVVDKYSAGCNELIRTQKAILIQSIDDLEKYTGWQLKRGAPPVQQQLFESLSPEETSIINTLRQVKEMAINELGIATKIPMHQLSVVLLQLEFRNVVKCMPGKRYRVT